jgi:23S rRNA (cytosine1962-C5)-methyltransferase
VNPFDTGQEVEISSAGVRRLRQGHLWVYAGDVTRDVERPEATFVRVTDAAHNILGHAFHSPLSQIRLRLFSRGSEPPGLALLRDRLKDSINRRIPLLKAGRACRLVFAEADLLPSIIVDRYGDFLVLQTLSRGSENLKTLLVDILRELIEPCGILERNDVKARRLEGLEEKRGVLFGTVPDNVQIEENGISFIVDLNAGQKTGFFLDQSENRLAARGYVSGRALDMFTNTGAFALHFAAHCESILAVDLARDSLEQGRRNAELNKIDNIEFREGNAFDILKELDRSGEKFGAVCLDPPAFAKNRGALPGAIGGYKEINLRAMKLLNPEGILVTSSCSYHLSEDAFLEVIREAARDAHRYIQVLERRSQAFDHPVLAAMPETHYLKCFIVRVL